ncbi:unnamed protein product [Oppiella nova]|uniref:Uncharacterized protein n=1 Tax=Oppiella nova TaxID=334625 RepID=A0A7R9QRV1_9ACAR|nr:unnamed protein product [Oppiella nova]CAG2171626.1 unnamed protein product [Oppiella nova]
MTDLIITDNLHRGLSLHVKVIRLLLHKNWLIRSHHKLSFLLLFVIPICFAILLLLLSGGERDRNNINNSDYLDIVYCPNNSYTNTLMEKVGDYLATKYRHRYCDLRLGV